MDYLIKTDLTYVVRQNDVISQQNFEDYLGNFQL